MTGHLESLAGLREFPLHLQKIKIRMGSSMLCKVNDRSWWRLRSSTQCVIDFNNENILGCNEDLKYAVLPRIFTNIVQAQGEKRECGTL